MEICELLSEDAILPSLKASSKKQLIQSLAVKAAEQTNINEREIFETLLQRERLGSTGVGGGIAIPHGKIRNLAAICGVMARLERPIDFDAMDDQPVDIVFLLLAPEGAGADHLRALAKIARLLRQTEIVQKLRTTSDAEALYSVLMASPNLEAA